MLKGIIYIARNIVNNKVYIGQTSLALKRRESLHRANTQRYKSYFHSALEKYPQDFEFKTFKEIKCKTKQRLKKKLDFWEKFLISIHKSTDKNLGYNLTIGGDGNLGGKMTEKNKQIVSERMKNNNPILSPKNRQIAIDNLNSKESRDKCLKYFRSKEARELRSKNVSGDKNPMRRFPEKNWMNDPIKQVEMRKRRYGS